MEAAKRNIQQAGWLRLIMLAAALMTVVVACSLGTYAYLHSATTPVVNAFVGAPAYYLNYDGNAGTDTVENIPDQQKEYVVGNFTISDKTPTRDGYLFTAWNTRADGGGTSLNPSQPYTTTARETTLYAQWMPDGYQLVYHANGGTGGPVTRKSQDNPEFAIENLDTLGIGPASQYKVFLGWADSPNPEPKKPAYGYQGAWGYTGDDFDQNTTTPLAANVDVGAGRIKHLYAVWATRYTLTFDAHMGTGPVPGPQSLVTTEATHTFQIPTEDIGPVPTRVESYWVEGELKDFRYKFQLWGNNAVRKKVTLWRNFGETVVLQESAPELTLYAYYQLLSSAVLIYEKNLPSDVVVSNMPDGTYVEVFGDSAALGVVHAPIRSEVPSAKLHYFRGWAEDQDAETGQYQSGNDYEMNLDKSPVHYLYAIWQQPHKFQLTLHGSGEGAKFDSASASGYNSAVFNSDKSQAVITSKEVDPHTTSHTFTGLSDGSTISRITARIFRPGYALVGWSRTPDSPTAEYPIAAGALNWYIDAPVKLEDELGDACPGNKVHNTDLYVVWKATHRFRIIFNFNTPDGKGDFKYSTAPDTYAYYRDGFNSYTNVGYWTSVDVDPSVQSYTLDKKFSAWMDDRNDLRFLGWSDKPTDTVPNPAYAMVNNKFVNPITIYDDDEHCEGGPVGGQTKTHVLRLYAIWQPRHTLGIVFHNSKANSFSVSLGNKSSGTLASGGVITNYCAPIDSTTTEYTVPAGVNFSASATGYRFLGWSETPGDTVPDPKYAVNASGKLIAPFTISTNETECTGTQGNGEYVRHEVLHLYAVFESLHAYAISFYEGDSGASLKLPTGWSWTGITAASGFRTYRSPFMSASVDQYAVNLIPTISRNGYKFLGWSTTKELRVVDHTYDVNASGNFVSPITLTEPDVNCAGGGKVHICLTLYPVWEPLHSFRINFNNVKSAEFVGASPIIGTYSTNGNYLSWTQWYTYTAYLPLSQKEYVIEAGTKSGKLKNSEDGHIFWGWADSASDTKPDEYYELNPNGTFKNPVIIRDAEENCAGGYEKYHTLNLYAKWKAGHRYTLRFNKGDADKLNDPVYGWRTSAYTLPGDLIYNTETSYTFPANSIWMFAYKKNYHFLGWSRNPNADVPEYRVETDTRTENGSSREAYENIEDAIVLNDAHTECAAGTSHIVDLYPVFEIDYSLTYDARGGTNAPATQTYDARKTDQGGGTYTFEESHEFTIYDNVSTNNPPVKDRYVFIGWGTQPNSQIPTYGYLNDTNTALVGLTGGLQDTITIPAATRRVTLYAVWRAEYVLKYDAGEGEGADAPTTGYSTAESLGLDSSSITPTRNGYRFAGWAEVPGGEPLWQASDKVPITGNGTGHTEKTIYAVWESTTNSPGGAGGSPNNAPPSGNGTNSTQGVGV